MRKVLGLVIFVGLSGSLACPLTGAEQSNGRGGLRQKYERVNPLLAQMRTLREEGQLEATRAVALQMIQVAEEEFGPEFMYIFEGRLTIGESYSAEQRYVEAKEVFQKLLTQLEQLSRSDKEGMGNAMLGGLFIAYSRTIAGHYKAWGDLDEAQAVLERALRTASEVLPNTALTTEIEDEIQAVRAQNTEQPVEEGR